MNIKFIFVSLYAFIVLSIGILPMFLFKNKIHSLRKMWAYTMIKILGVDIEEIGKLNINADIMILNHNSILDFILLEHLHPKEISWVTKDTLSKLPLFGYILKLPKLILIDPTKRSSLKKLLHEVEQANKDQRPVAIFPEGRHGETHQVANFQKGIKIVAEELNLKAQVIVLTNTKKILDMKKCKASSGKIKVIYLDTFDTLKDDWFENVEHLVKTTYYQEI